MSSIRKNYLYNVILQIFTFALPLITTPYVSRVIGPTGVGQYSYAYSIAYYFSIFILLGLNNYGNRAISASRDNNMEMSKIFCNIYFTQFIIGIIVLFIYFAYCTFAANNRTIAVILGLYVFSAVLDINWFLYGMEAFKMTAIRNIAVKLFCLIGIFLLVKTSSDLYLYCLILSGSYVLSQASLWPYAIANVHFIRPNKKDVAKHLRGSLILFISVIAVSLFKVMDKVMLGVLTTYDQVGFYESSEKIINIPVAFINALGLVMLPRMSNLVANKSDEDKGIIRLSILFAMLVSSSMCFGIMGVAENFVPLFYGDGYETCITLYMILLPSCLFLAFANVIRTQYLLPHKMDRAYIISAFLGAIVNFIINILLIPQYGAIGAALGTLCAEAAVCISQCFACRGSIPVLYYVQQGFPMVLSGIVMFLVLQVVKLDFTSSILLLLAKIVMGVIIYFVTLFILIIIFRKSYSDLIERIITIINKHKRS